MCIVKNARSTCILVVCFAMMGAPDAHAGSCKIQVGGNVVDDARITSLNPFFNGGDDPWGNVTYFSSNGNTERFYIRIPLPALVDSVHCDSISQVNLRIYFRGLQTPGFKICAQRVTDPWDEHTITWNTKPQNDTTILDTISLSVTPVWVTFPLTEVFKNWLCGQRPNEGVLLRAFHEGQGEQNTAVCVSSDDSARSQRPLLEIVSSELPDTLITEYPTSVNTRYAAFQNGFSISPNYPNPFNPSTTLEYSLPTTTVVSLKIYNLLGQEQCTLVNEQRNAGVHSVQWNASKSPSGVYIAILRTERAMSRTKMVLLK